MEFNPNNKVIQLCVQGSVLEERGDVKAASDLYQQAWNTATDDFEKFTAAHFVARVQSNTADKLQWFETSLQFALKSDNPTIPSALPYLYTNIAKCYAALAESHNNTITDTGPFYHGTKANLAIGDLLTPGNRSNYQSDIVMNHIYFTAVVHGAGLAAALAQGDGAEHVYIVEPTGAFENDPNVTDKKFPGNPTRSYRTTEPLKIVGEVTDWVKQTPEQLQHWRERLAKSNGKIIN